MAWTAPKTFTSGSALLFSELNTYLRDNLNQTFPALATTDNQYLVSNGANAPAARQVATNRVETSETFVSAGATWGDCATVGPSCLNMTTGTRALAFISCATKNTGTGPSRMGVDVSGTTTLAATTNYAFVASDPGGNNWMGGCLVVSLALTAGTNNDFVAKYQCDSGTSTFIYRELTIFPF